MSRLYVTGSILDGASERPIASFSTYVSAGSAQGYIGSYTEKTPGNGVIVQVESVSPSSDSTYSYWY